jgi:hypothetical protein
MCGVLLARCVRGGTRCDAMPCDAMPASPFIVSKGRARVTLVVTRRNRKRQNRKTKKVASGVTVFLLIQQEQFSL